MGSTVADFMNEVLLCFAPQMLNNRKETGFFQSKRILKCLTLSCLCAKSTVNHLQIKLYHLPTNMVSPLVFLTHTHTRVRARAHTHTRRLLQCEDCLEFLWIPWENKQSQLFGGLRLPANQNSEQRMLLPGETCLPKFFASKHRHVEFVWGCSLLCSVGG